MKKSAVLSVILSACLFLTSCGSNTASPQETEPPKETVVDTEQVENVEITLTWDTWSTEGNDIISITRTGQYTGTLVNGIPNGQGTFEAENDGGNYWIYTGGFKDGKFQGEGRTEWPNEGTYEVGNYEAGLFTPDICDLLNTYSCLTPVPYQIGQENQAFLRENPDLFPVTTTDAAAKMASLTDTSLTYSMLAKTLSGHEGTLYQKNSCYVVQAFETELYGHTLTYLLCCDLNDLTYYFVLYDGALPDVYAETVVDFTGLPIAYSSYDNANGGSTYAVVLAGCSVQISEG